MNIFVDGIFRQSVNLFNTTDSYFQAVYTSPVLPLGTHSIELRNAGTTSGADHDMYFDGLQVTR